MSAHVINQKTLCTVSIEELIIGLCCIQRHTAPFSFVISGAEHRQGIVVCDSMEQQVFYYFFLISFFVCLVVFLFVYFLPKTMEILKS